MRSLAALLLVSAFGCSKIDVGLDEPKQEPFEVQIRVVSDPGVPMAEVQILSAGKVVGQTDASGSAKLRFGGKEGDQVELTPKCPPEYEPPAAPLAVALRRLAPGSRAAQFELQCRPTLRTAVVAVRTENASGLPVTYLGRTVARTDASGAALFSLRVKPGEQVPIVLSTMEKGEELLHPQNPTLTFVARDQDDYVVLDQTFTADKKPVVYRPKPDHRPKPL